MCVFQIALLSMFFQYKCSMIKLLSYNVKYFFYINPIFKPSDDYNDSLSYRLTSRQDKRPLNDEK